MSYYHNDNGLSQHRINSPDSAYTTYNPSQPFLQQAALIPQKCKFQYKSTEGLIRTITSLASTDPTEQFLYIDGFGEQELEAIPADEGEVQLRSLVRFTIENSLNAAILRLIPGTEHGTVGETLYLEIVLKILSIPGHNKDSIAGVGATRFRVPGVRSKEGDKGIRPRTRNGREAWPSLMMEIGHSETLGLLQIDAEWWLRHSEGRTRFVILTKIDHNSFHLRIECWKMEVMSSPSDGAPSTVSRIPQCVQDFDIDAAGMVTSPLGSTELTIPYDCIFDIPSSSNPGPIEFSYAELSAIALGLYELIQ